LCSQLTKMSISKPFSQCSLSDLAPAISARASAASALDPVTADRLLPALHNAALTEAALLRHPLVRDRSGLKCDDSAHSKLAWCGMLRDLVAAAGVDVSDAALLRVFLVCKECAKLERTQLCSSSPASAAAEDGGALAASPAPVAAPRRASSSLSAARGGRVMRGRRVKCSAAPCRASSSLSTARGPPLTFTYHDRFLGKAVRIPVLHRLQIAAPLMLVTPALHFARGRAAAGSAPQHPAPPVGCMMVELWPAQCTRFMFGFTLKACDRASTAPASSHVHLRTASRWSAGILQRVMAGYGNKVQVWWLLRMGARRLFC